MGNTTSIEWTDGGGTWTPIRARYLEPQNDGSGKLRIGWHCEHASEGCRNCYSEGINIRLGTGREFKPANLFRQEKVGFNNGEVKVFLDEKMLLAPLHWRRPRKIFVCSMTDLFADFVPDAWIDRVFAVMALAPQHTFQVLTKRPERMKSYLLARNGMGNVHLCRAINEIPAAMGDRHGALEMPLPHTWLGVSVEDQKTADQRIPHLLATPAAVRFLSCEPLLGPIDLNRIENRDAERTGFHASALHQQFDGNYFEFDRQIDWVIVGGESGPNARPMHPDWTRSLRDQCAAASVPFFFKQWGAWLPVDAWSPGPPFAPELAIMRDGSMVPDDVAPQDVGGHRLRRVGKKAAGRLLEGVEHSEMPGNTR